MLEKYNADVGRTTTKYEHTHTVFAETFNKKSTKQLFQPVDTQELYDPEKVSAIWVKNLKNIVNKMNNTKSSITGTKFFKLGIVKLDKLEKYTEENTLSADGFCRYLYQPGEQHGHQKRWSIDFIWSKNTYRSDRTMKEPGNCVLYYLPDGPNRAFVPEELLHIPEDIQLLPEWINKWK